jgi:cation-transporting ATPase E
VPAARTAALLAVLVTALWTVLVLARPLTAGRVALVAAMAGVVVLVLAVPLLRDDVLLLVLSSTTVLLGTGLGAVGALLVEAVSRMPGTRLPRAGTERAGDRR